jgi:hypothetical protein
MRQRKRLAELPGERCFAGTGIAHDCDQIPHVDLPVSRRSSCTGESNWAAS